MNASIFLAALNQVDDRLIRQADLFLSEPDAHRGRMLRTAARWSLGTAFGLALIVGLLTLGHLQRGVDQIQNKDQSSAAVAEAATEENSASHDDALLEIADGLEPGALIFDSENRQVTADIAKPEGSWIEELTEEQISTLWGGNLSLSKDWGLNWQGSAVYLADATPWIVSLSASVPYPDGSTRAVKIELSPGALPPTCTPFPFTPTCELWGTPVAAHRSVQDGKTAWLGAEFIREGEEPIGARISISAGGSFTGEDARNLLETLLTHSLSPGSAFTLSGITPRQGAGEVETEVLYTQIGDGGIPCWGTPPPP